MARKRVLVFPCGSEVGLEIHRSLAWAKEVELLGASSVDDHGRFAFRNYFGGIPFVTAPDFINQLNSLIKSQQVDYVFPAHDGVVLAVAEAADQRALACRVLTSPVETCRVCRSKSRTLDVFAGKLRVPRLVSDVAENKSWPVFLKPDVGQGSKGTGLARSPEEVRHLQRQVPGCLVLEHLPGPEYTVDCFTDRHGQLTFVGARSRVRVQNGISVNTVPVDNPELMQAAETINATLRFRGTWFFQMKQACDGRLALLEIAPRISGSMSLYRNLGVNFALLSLYDAEGIPVRASINHVRLEMDRALNTRFRIDYDYTDVYIDLDDCLVCAGQLNTQAIAFLHQCVNRGISVHLLTRHDGTLPQKLRQLRISDLFDRVHHLQKDEPKSKYIQPGKSVFIDDSFRERQEVAAALGIPVFAPDAIESLLL